MSYSISTANRMENLATRQEIMKKTDRLEKE
jgi:hypothetical protein